jgi:hypothetical protein
LLLQMEHNSDDFNFEVNGKQPQFFGENGRQPQFYCKVEDDTFLAMFKQNLRNLQFGKN